MRYNYVGKCFRCFKDIYSSQIQPKSQLFRNIFCYECKDYKDKKTISEIKVLTSII